MALATVRYKTKRPPEGKEDQGQDPCIGWTGWFSKIPILKFHAQAVVSKEPSMRKLGGCYNFSFKMVHHRPSLVRNLLYAHGFKQVNGASHDFNVMWAGGELEDSIFSNLSSFQKINHFPKSTELTRKDSLWKTMHSFEEEHQKNFNIVPESYVLPEDYQEFCQAFEKIQGPWIVKPVASSQGRGIYLMDSLSQLNIGDNVLVSRYISNPLLIEGYKFDFRLYVLITSFDPLIIYLYEEGLTRFATEKYQQSGTCMENKFVHLTNASLNKTSTKYVVSDDPEVEDFGNKWTMGALLRYLRQHGKDTTLLMEQIEDLIIKTIISAEGPIVEACRSILPQRGNCFELFGFDVLIDENLKPWLLEINRSPALECGSPLDLKIKANLMADVFTLVGIECLDPRQKSNGSSSTSTQQIQRTKKRMTPEHEVEMDTVFALHQLKEETKRRGGFVCLFPLHDTWQRYGSLFQNSILNFMLASYLHVEKPPSHDTSWSRSEQNAALYERKLAPVQQNVATRQAPSTSKTLHQSSQKGSKDMDRKKSVDSPPRKPKPSYGSAGGMKEPLNVSATTTTTTSLHDLSQRLLKRSSQLSKLAEGFSALRRQVCR